MTDETSEKIEDEARAGSNVHGLRDIIERTFMAGMGAAALTKDRVTDLIEELVRLGQINADEGRDVVEKLVTRTRDDARAMLKRVDLSSPSAYREQLLVVQQQLDDQELRLRQLEHRIQLLEGAADTQAKTASQG
jgi:polyhydroxyalkanoate synthesis regulator phasin